MTTDNATNRGSRWLVSAFCLLLSPLAGASLIGDTIRVQIGALGTPQDVLVGAGTEITTSVMSIDIAADTITVDFSDVFLDSIYFSNIDEVIGAAVGGSEYSLTSLAVTHTAHTITAAVENNTPPGGFVITLRTSGSVPAPATLALMGLGLAGVGFTRKMNRFRYLP